MICERANTDSNVARLASRPEFFNSLTVPGTPAPACAGGFFVFHPLPGPLPHAGEGLEAAGLAWPRNSKK